MKYPLYVYKRLNGQEYRCGVGDGIIQNLQYEKEKDSTADTAESPEKISQLHYNINKTKYEETLLNDLKCYARALEKVKETSLEKALKDDEFADVAAGQFVAYASCQNMLLEIIMEYERSAIVGRDDAITA